MALVREEQKKAGVEVSQAPALLHSQLAIIIAHMTLTRALAGGDLPTVMQHAFWKKPSTAWRYFRLVEVLVPGSVGNSMVTGVSREQSIEINEFGLSEQCRHWAAFRNAPMV